MESVALAEGGWVSAFIAEEGEDRFEVFAAARWDEPAGHMRLSTEGSGTIDIPTFHGDWQPIPGREEYEIAAFPEWTAGEVEIRRRGQ